MYQCIIGATVIQCGVMRATATEMVGEVVHFEIPYVKGDRARKFYSKVFGWKLRHWEDPSADYTLVTTGPVDKKGMLTKPGMINGGMMKRMPKVKSPVIYMMVDDVEATLVKIEKMGGKRITDSTPVGEMGWSAYFQDPEGNLLGVFQTNPKLRM
jgi:predicted enzyme related to lactoylglutathione lyase